MSIHNAIVVRAGSTGGGEIVRVIMVPSGLLDREALRKIQGLAEHGSQTFESIVPDVVTSIEGVEEIFDEMNASDEASAFRNYYRHDDCPKQPGVEWQDEADCACNDRCPACRAEIEPYKSVAVDEDGEEIGDEDEPRGFILGMPIEPVDVDAAE